MFQLSGLANQQTTVHSLLNLAEEHLV